MSRLRFVVIAIALFVVPSLASAACVNKFVHRAEGPRQIVTLLTGKLTFQEAEALAKAIASKQSPPLEWVDDGGKLLARQFGDLKPVRPMPVACDNHPSGSVVIVTFPTLVTPAKKMRIKLDANTIVDFDEQ